MYVNHPPVQAVAQPQCAPPSFPRHRAEHGVHAPSVVATGVQVTKIILLFYLLPKRLRSRCTAFGAGPLRRRSLIWVAQSIGVSMDVSMSRSYMPCA